MKRLPLYSLLLIVLGFITIKTASAQVHNSASCYTILPEGYKVAVHDVYRWEKGKVITVSFLEKNEFMIAKVKQFAAQWDNIASITFKYVSKGPADIRITFSGEGYWSLLGIQSRTTSVNLRTRRSYANSNGPTMNIQAFETYEEDSIIATYVLHEFGHALGLIHEHQSPAVNIPWNRPAVYADHPEWTRAEVDHNIFRRYSAGVITNSAYDKYSIMHYPIKETWVTDPSFAVGWNRQLSPTDIAFVRKVYSKPKPKPKEPRGDDRGPRGEAVPR